MSCKIELSPLCHHLHWSKMCIFSVEIMHSCSSSVLNDVSIMWLSNCQQYISVKSWRSVLLVEETGVPRKKTMSCHYLVVSRHVNMNTTAKHLKKKYYPLLTFQHWYTSDSDNSDNYFCFVDLSDKISLPYNYILDFPPVLFGRISERRYNYYYKIYF